MKKFNSLTAAAFIAGLVFSVNINADEPNPPVNPQITDVEKDAEKSNEPREDVPFGEAESNPFEVPPDQKDRRFAKERPSDM